MNKYSVTYLIPNLTISMLRDPIKFNRFRTGTEKDVAAHLGRAHISIPSWDTAVGTSVTVTFMLMENEIEEINCLMHNLYGAKLKTKNIK